MSFSLSKLAPYVNMLQDSPTLDNLQLPSTTPMHNDVLIYDSASNSWNYAQNATNTSNGAVVWGYTSPITNPVLYAYNNVTDLALEAKIGHCVFLNKENYSLGSTIFSSDTFNVDGQDSTAIIRGRNIGSYSAEFGNGCSRPILVTGIKSSGHSAFKTDIRNDVTVSVSGGMLNNNQSALIEGVLADPTTPNFSFGVGMGSGGYKNYISLCGKTEDGAVRLARVELNTSSDGRLKHNQEDITDGIEVIKKLRPLQYDKTPYMSEEGDTENSIREAGFVAQDVLRDIPELSDYVVTPSDPQNEPYDLKYKDISVFHVAATKQLIEENEYLKDKIKSLEEQIIKITSHLNL